MKLEITNLDLFKKLELFEEKAWLNMYQLAPNGWANRFGLSHEQTPHGVFFFCEKIPFIHFNCAMTLGINQYMPAEILDLYDHKCIVKKCAKSFLIVSPIGDTDHLHENAIKKSFNPIGGWERVHRPFTKLPALKPSERTIEIFRVDESKKVDWATFIDTIYQLPTSPWLLSLSENHGWHHFIAKENNKIIAARSLYIKDKMAWSGIDAPVPGIMTTDYEPDHNLFYSIFEYCNQSGVEHFICDIELPNATQASAPYQFLKEMGCEVLYQRMNYMKVY